jgi:hypothetical protein
MSENSIAASKPKRRIGCKVSSAASFGSKQRSRKSPAAGARRALQDRTGPGD